MADVFNELVHIRRFLASQMTRPGLLRTLLPSRFSPRAQNVSPIVRTTAAVECNGPGTCLQNCRCFAQVQDLDKLNRDVWFTSSLPRYVPEGGPGGDHKPPDQRTLQLGKSMCFHEGTECEMLTIHSCTNAP